MLKLPVPKANFHTEVIKPSPMQQDIIKSLADRAEEIRAGNIDPSIDNMLKITNRNVEKLIVNNVKTTNGTIIPKMYCCFHYLLWI